MAIESELIGKDKLDKIFNKIEKLNNKSLSKKVEKKALNRIGVAWTGTIKQNIANGVDYNGSPLLRPQKRNGQPLLDTGRLVSSINPIVKNDLLSIGTPVYYSKWLNDGTSKMQERPFIPTKQSEIPKSWWVIASKITLEVSKEEIEEDLKGK